MISIQRFLLAFPIAVGAAVVAFVWTFRDVLRPKKTLSQIIAECGCPTDLDGEWEGE